MIEAFQLGYGNRTLGYRLPAGQVKAGAALRGQLQRLGVYRSSGHEHFYGCVTVPLFDAEGQIVQMYGRRIGAVGASDARHLFMRGGHRGVFNRAAFTASKEIVLCEAVLDALTFWCAGFRHVTTSYGVEGFTPELREAFGANEIKRVLIAYDADEAGNRAAEKLAPELAAMGLSVFRVNFPRKMDANEYAQKLRPAEKSLGTALRAAHWMAGGRAVQVAVEVSKAHAKNWVAADVNGDGLMPTREAVEPELSRRNAADEEVTPSLAADLEAAPVREEAVKDAVERADLAITEAHENRPSVSTDGEAEFTYGARTWRIRGLEKVTSVSAIKVNVRVMQGAMFFLDTLDVCAHRARAAFLKQAAEELEIEERVLKHDLGRVLQALEGLVEQRVRKLVEPSEPKATMSEAERNEALSLLRDPRLLDRVLEDFARCGVVGEETNKLVSYLAATSRKLHDPLALVIQSSSAAGKSSLMDAVLRFVPEEEKAAYAAMTGQALFYMGESNLQHKVLAIAEEAGAKNAAYALKILQSSGELTIASTGKDERTGKLATHEYRVTGPVMIMMTTTAIEVDEELLNRCIVLSVDEGAEQTRAIHVRQRQAETLEGMARQAAEQRILRLHQNAQRLVKPMRVVNPYANELSFSWQATRARRDHKKYLTLMRAIALLHQHQRPVKEYADEQAGVKFRYIEVTREDVALAEKLCGQVLARSLDELAPQTRKLLMAIEALVTERAALEQMEASEVRFTQRELREHTRWSATQIKVQLQRLVQLEYVTMQTHREHRQRILYGLSYTYDGNRSGKESDRSGSGPLGKGPVLLRDVAEVSEPVRVLRDTLGRAPSPDRSYTSAASASSAAE
jgi:DNA primase